MVEYNDQEGVGGETDLREGVDSQDISALADELVAMKKGAAFADEFYGSPWNVPPAPCGWRHDMQKWAESRGLIKPIANAWGVGEYVGFTRKGELLREELHRRGCTIVAGRKF